MVESASEIQVANFWPRTFAFLIDAVIIAVPVVLGGLALGPVAAWLLAAFLYPLYCALCEQSSWQATAGKRVFGLRAVDLDGWRLSVARSFARNLCKYVSAGSGGCGFLIAAFTSDHQAIHDLLASTLVVRRPNGDAAG